MSIVSLQTREWLMDLRRLHQRLTVCSGETPTVTVNRLAARIVEAESAVREGAWAGDETAWRHMTAHLDGLAREVDSCCKEPTASARLAPLQAARTTPHGKD